MRIVGVNIEVDVLGLGFAGTMVFYWFAQSEQYRDFLAKPIITSLYHRYQWRWLRKEHALEVFLVGFNIFFLNLEVLEVFIYSKSFVSNWHLLQGNSSLGKHT